MIIRWLKALWHSVNVEPVEAYLGTATDVVDLEHRMRKVERGEAPFQRSNISVYSSNRFGL